MKNRRPSVPLVINLSLIAVTTAVLVTFGFVDFTQQRDKRFQDLHADLATMTEQLGSSLALPFWNFQDDQAIKIVENAMRDRYVAAIIAKDTITQRIVVARIRAADGTPEHAEAPPLGEDLIHKQGSITFNSRDIGLVDVYVTPEYVREALKETLFRLVLNIALVNTIMVLLLYFILNRNVMLPLKAVETYALKVSSEEYADASVPRGNFLQEIENLRDSIVIMVEKLRHRYEELKQSQSGLAEAEARYRNLYENALAGIFRCTPDGRFLSANSAMASILGMEPPLNVFDQATDFFGQVLIDGAERKELNYLLGIYGEVSKFEVRFKRSDGDVRIGTLHARSVTDDKGIPLHIDGMLEDITERTRAEAMLLDAHEFIQNILDSMPSMVIGIDDAMRITHFNRTTETSTGLSHGHLLGLKLTEVLPRLSSQAEAIGSALQEGRPVSLPNQPYILDEQIRQENILIFPIVREGVRGAVIRLDDVTDQARMEELILQTEKMMSLGGLAAGMAHEINNPLAGILQSVQNITRRVSPGFEANVQAAEEAGCSLDAIRGYLEKREVFEFLSGIKVAGERAAKIVSNMLSFTRSTSMKSIPTRLDELLDKSVELASTDYDIKKKYDFKRIRIEREYPAEALSVPCVPMEIEQVIINLLRNAAQAMASHPNPPSEPRIVLRLRVEGKMAVIEVDDNGPGIAEKDRRKVFEPFYTTKKTWGRNRPGAVRVVFHHHPKPRRDHPGRIRTRQGSEVHHSAAHALTGAATGRHGYSKTGLTVPGTRSI